MAVIDVDAHFEPAADWLDRFPEVKERFPALLPDDDPRFALNSAEMFAYFVTDDLLRGVARERRMPIDQLVTPAMEFLFADDCPPGLVYDGADQFKELLDPAERIAWMDAQGIAKQNIITGTGYTLPRAITDGDLARDAIRAINTWMAEAVAGHTDRLMPVTTLHFGDLDWAIEELTRMRALGSRTFTISAEPVDGIPPNHPDYDRFWSAATDLGMIALVHIGTAPSLYHPGWANTDDPAIIRLLSVQQPAQTVQTFLSAMVFGGVFERHPKLTVLISELGIDWFAPQVEGMESSASPGVSPLVLGEYKLPLSPKEYVRRNIRISPLPVPYQSPVKVLERLPEVAVFSSDFPHFEGSGDPMAHYRTELESLDPSLRDGFLGGNIEASFALMGDPL